jgi:hypothetical protein
MMDFYVDIHKAVHCTVCGRGKNFVIKKNFLQNCLTYIIDQGKLAEVVSAAGKQLLLLL